MFITIFFVVWWGGVAEVWRVLGSRPRPSCSSTPVGYNRMPKRHLSIARGSDLLVVASILASFREVEQREREGAVDARMRCGQRSLGWFFGSNLIDLIVLIVLRLDGLI